MWQAVHTETTMNHKMKPLLLVLNFAFAGGYCHETQTQNDHMTAFEMNHVAYDGQTKHKIQGHIMNVLCVPAAFPPKPYGTNMYIIWCKDTRDAVIIDPGMETFDTVLEAIRQYSLNPVAIWITHSHWDHIVDAAKIKKEFSLPVFMHEEDKGNLENPGSDGVPMAVSAVEGTTLDHLLKDGDLLTVGKVSFKVIHTPGHTPGGICFYCPEENILFSGDTFYKGLIGSLSLPTSEPGWMWQSLDKIALLPSDTIVYPGHGPSTTIKDESWLSQAKTRGVVHS